MTYFIYLTSAERDSVKFSVRFKSPSLNKLLLGVSKTVLVNNINVLKFNSPRESISLKEISTSSN